MPSRSIRCIVNWIGVRHKVSLQVDEVGISPVSLTFVAHSGREAGFSIPTTTEDDNWDERQGILRPLTTPNVKRHPIIRKRLITYRIW